MRRFCLISVVVLAGCFSAVGEPGGSGGGNRAAGGGSGGNGTGGGTAGAGGSLSCVTDSDCNAGEVCEECRGERTCLQGCRNDSQCSGAMSCILGQACFTCPCAPGACAIDPCFDADNDGFVTTTGSTCSGKKGGDCNDANPRVNPSAVESCTNGIDDDCDGRIDGSDTQCTSCMGGNGCGINLDCRIGQTFCRKSMGTTAACCAECPIFDGDCVQGSSPRASGIDPMTGCQVISCVADTGIACPDIYQPVCGTNGQTYGNSCELAAVQETLLHTGECLPGEGLDCGWNGAAQCGTSGNMYCRDACPVCDAWVMRCTKVGVCVYDTDCPAGAPPPPVACPDGSNPRAACVSHACQYSCP